MFDVGFGEMVIIGLIALLVFGPERLPRVAREAGAWIRKIKALANNARNEITIELEYQELKRKMNEAAQAQSNQASDGEDARGIGSEAHSQPEAKTGEDNEKR